MNVDVEARVFGAAQYVCEITVVVNRATGVPRSRHVEYVMDESRSFTTHAESPPGAGYNRGPEVTGSTSQAIDHDVVKKISLERAPGDPS